MLAADRAPSQRVQHLSGGQVGNFDWKDATLTRVNLVSAIAVCCRSVFRSRANTHTLDVRGPE